MAPYTRRAAPYTSVAMLSSAHVCGTRMAAGCQDPFHNDTIFHNDTLQHFTNTVVCFTSLMHVCLAAGKGWHLRCQVAAGSKCSCTCMRRMQRGLPSLPASMGRPNGLAAQRWMEPEVQENNSTSEEHRVLRPATQQLQGACLTLSMHRSAAQAHRRPPRRPGPCGGGRSCLAAA
jgi:hypothetical protein